MALEPCVDQERDTIYPPAYPKCGCVPEPTAEDAGKAPVVSVSNVPGAVIVPEQTVTISSDNSAVLSNVNSSLFVGGQECIIEIDGATYEATLEDNGGMILANINNYTYIINYNPYQNAYLFNTQVQGTHTVKVTAVEKEAQYTLEPVGYDLVIENQGNFNLNQSSAGPFVIKSGTYADCEAKLIAGEPINVMLYGRYYNDATDMGMCIYGISAITWDLGYHECMEIFAQTNPTSLSFAATHLYVTESGVSKNAPW